MSTGSPDADPVDLSTVFRSPPRSIRRLPGLILGGIRIAWRASPREFALNAALQGVIAVGVAVQVLVTQQLLQRLLALDDGTGFGEVMPWVAVLSLATAAVSFATLVRTERQFLMGELVGRHTMDQVLEVSTTVDLVAYDSPEFHNRLLRAQLNAAARPIQMANGVLGISSALVSIVGISVALLFIHPLFVAALLVAYLPLWLVTAKVSRVSYAFSVEQAERDRQRDYLSNVLARREEAAEVRAYGLERFLRRRHDGLYDERLTALRRVVERRTRLGLMATLVTSILNAAALTLLVWFVTSGRLDVAAAGAAAGAMLLFAQRLSALASSAGSLYESALFIEDFTSFVDAVPVIAGRRPTGPAPEAFDEIRLDHVSFTYPTRRLPALHDVSLTLRRGEVVALVGENGSGKTTLAKLLAGLYQPSSGTICWDGVDLASVDPSAVRDHVAVIFQDFVRYQFSARDNIALGRHTRFDDDEAAVAAARRASADGFLEALPRGYATRLGAQYWGGSDLSLGQWQRVALARAFFRDAPLLILDEPTASLDARTETELFDRMSDLASGRTVLLISHRFSTVRSADRIFVLDRGRIVESGAHEELMQQRGLYAELFSLQANAYLGVDEARGPGARPFQPK